jgi:tellurite resistance-related uncharacterized protein
MPVGLLRAHRIARGMWGRIVVRHGRLNFRARTEPALEIVVNPDSIQAIPPEVEHEVRPLGPVRFSIDFLSIPERDPGNEAEDTGESVAWRDVTVQRVPDQGGETACWAYLLCAECGVVLDGGAHVNGCRSADTDPTCLELKSFNAEEYDC